MKENYGVFRFTRKQYWQNILLYAVLDALISALFYRSPAAFFLFIPGIKLFLRARKKELLRLRSQELLREFMTGMQLVNSSLQAGYAIENAFPEALGELRKIYPEDSFIIREFRWIAAQTRLNVPVESLLTDLGRRSHVDDIRSFAEVFQTAKRTGGDLIAIVRGTVASIQSKTQTREEIETMIAGKTAEQKVMSAAPLLLIAYTTLTSPGFLDVCYHNPTGILIMTVCLIIYLAAYLWGRRIMCIDF